MGGLFGSTGVVDMSGTVSAILQNYFQVVRKCQQLVTGDPVALTAAATQAGDEASALATMAGELQQGAQGLQPQWQGIAFDAFNGTTVALAADLDTAHDQLVAEAQKLTKAASALSTAASQMTNLVNQFTQSAQQLIQESTAASAMAVNAFVSAAQQLGESAVTAATQLVQQLGSALASAFGFAASATTTADNGAKGFGDTKSDQGKAVKNWLTNQSWFKNWYKSTYGKNPDPGNLKFGALDWFSGDGILDGRKAQGMSSFYNSGWYKLTDDGLSSTSAPLKANTPFGSLTAPGDDASTTQKLLFGSNVTLWDSGKQPVSGLSDGISGTDSGSLNMGNFGTATGTLTGSVGPMVTDQNSLTIHSGQLQYTGDLKGTLLDGSVAGSYTDGPVSASANGEAMVGGDLSGHLSGGLNGVEAHVNAFAGAQVTGSASADVAGVGVGVNGSLQAGVGAQLDAQATMDNGVIKGNFKVGAALGVGASVGGNVEINLPKMWSTAQQYGGAVVNSVENAAGQAASTIGNAMANGAYAGAF